MASEDDSSKGFKIQDRRRFSSEGELKPEFSGADEPAAAESSAGHAHGGGTRGAAEPHHHAAAATQPQQAAAAAGYAAARSAAGPESPETAAQAGEINFGAFLMSLSTEALVYLGEMPDPAGGGEPHHDLGMAQQLIDILGMLREKTRGNLDRDEQALLDAILFDLRMKYVEIARRNG
jgi:hypothetical protein